MARSTTRLSLAAMVAAAILLISSLACSQTIPRLMPGRHVYAIPANYFVPEGGPAGTRLLESALRRLHYPCIVLLIDQAPIRNTEAAFNAYMDRVIEQWRVLQPTLLTEQTSVFVLVRRPHRVRLKAGERWSSQLGLNEERAHEYVTTHFVPRAAMPERAPIAGIIETLEAFDAFVFEETDTAQLRVREQQQRAAEQERARLARVAQEEREAEARATALTRTSNEIARAERLLGERAGYLPDDLRSIRDALDAAREARHTAHLSVPSILGVHARLVQENDRLWRYIRDRKEEEGRHTTLKMTIAVIVAIIIFHLIRKARRRMRRIKDLRSTLLRKIVERQEVIDKNMAKRQEVLGRVPKNLSPLSRQHGLTSDLYRRATGQADRVRILLEGMRKNLADCRALGEKGWLFNEQPLVDAITQLDQAFVFDTRVIDMEHLFHPREEQPEVNIDPSTFGHRLDGELGAAVEDWLKLQAASRALESDPRKDLPLDEFRALRKRAKECGIPDIWYEDHPLYGDSNLIYATLAWERNTDALKYAAQITELRRKAQEAQARVEKIIKLIAPVRAELGDVTIPSNTRIENDDDPKEEIAESQRQEAILRELLQTRTPEETLTNTVNAILDARRQATYKARRVHEAIDQVKTALEEARTDLQQCRAAQFAAGRELVKQRVGYSDPLRQHIADGERTMGLGTNTLMQANLAERRGYHLKAHRLAREAAAFFRAASGEFAKIESRSSASAPCTEPG